VARHAGAGEKEKADHASAQGIVLAVLVSALLAFAARPAPAALFAALRTAPEVARDGARYLGPLLLCSLPAFLMITLEGILRAWGNTRTPMLITSAALGANFILDPFLILGWGPFPAWGVRGAAVATILSQSLGAILLIAYFHRHRAAYPGIARHLFTRDFRIDFRVMGRLARIGAPPTLSSFLFSVVYLVLSRAAAQMGTAPLAILGVGNRLESFSYLTASSLSIAAATVVGQNLGAGQPERARQAGRVAALLGAGLTGVIGLSFFALGGLLFAAFTSDPEVCARGGEYMKVLALCQPFMGVEIALFGAFAGAGYTLAPTWISAGISLLRIPLSFLVALRWGYGLMGLAWVLSITCVLRALLLLLLYGRGRWLHS
jgi:putative MATE family efflux protein